MMTDRREILSLVLAHRIALVGILTGLLPLPQGRAQQAQPAAGNVALYRQANAPVERRIGDLLGRMTLEEMVRQLDLYAGARTLVDKQKDPTHAAADAVFLPEKAEALWEASA